MKYETLLYEKKEGNVALVTLNRPDRLNALSEKLREELIAMLEEAEADEEIKIIVLTGAPRPDGRPCFSAGADIKEMAGMGTTVQAKAMGTLEEGVIKTLWALGEDRDMWQFAFNRLQAFPKPAIAAIDGVCTAGGLELALCCDLRVAATSAQFSDKHMKTLGILGGGGLQTLLPHAVGLMKAKELCWTGVVIDGEEARRIGLVCQVFPPEKLMEGVMSLAHNIASNSPLGMRLSKMALNASLSQGIYESLRFSAFCESLHRYMSRADIAKAFDAFSKR